ncbi:MAG: CRISPR-associated endonuclease Cas2, partial [Treponema sp.]
MWIFCMFDLPTNTKPQRKRASEFRKNLLEDGFEMMQFSV